MARSNHPAADLIGSKEAAARMGLSRDHFNRLVRSGLIPVAVKLHGRTAARLFDPADIDRVKRDRTGRTGAA